MASTPDLLSCLAGRDFAGALACLRFTRGLAPGATAQWRAFLHFHAGRYEDALEVYRALQADHSGNGGGGGKSFHLHIAACLYRLRRWAEAQRAAEQVGDAVEDGLQIRPGAALLRCVQCYAADWEGAGYGAAGRCAARPRHRSLCQAPQCVQVLLRLWR